MAPCLLLAAPLAARAQTAPEPTPDKSAFDNTAPLRPPEVESPTRSSESGPPIDLGASVEESTPIGAPITAAESPFAASASALTPSKLFTLGGGYLQRLEFSGASDSGKFFFSPHVPALVDLFLDIQPTTDFRGYLLTRFAFDPTALGNTAPLLLLDQLWFRYELQEKVYFTLGRQQINWGSGRVWRPTDFLRKINPTPLEIVDLRTGTDMLRVHVPVTPLGSNFYAIGFVQEDGPPEEPLRYGGALRAEVAVGGIGEVSASAVVQQQRRPRLGVEANFGFGPLDVYAEAALLHDAPKRLWAIEDGTFVQRAPPQAALQASAGASTRLRVTDFLVTYLRLEYFHNGLGYTDERLLGYVITTGDYEPLYFSRDYLMFEASFTMRNPYEPWLQLFTIANLTDFSLQTRLNFRVLINAGVEAGAFVEVPWGDPGSEFRVAYTGVAPPTGPPTGVYLFRFGLWGRVQF